MRDSILKSHNAHIQQFAGYKHVMAENFEVGSPHTTLPVQYITDVGLQDRICEMLERGQPGAGRAGCPVVVMDTEGQRADLIQLLVPTTHGSTVFLFHNLPITKWLVKLMESRRVLKVNTPYAPDF